MARPAVRPFLQAPALGDLFRQDRLVRTAGAHSALGAAIAQEVGFDAIWASSFEISAARCLPDASLLTMTDYLQVTVQMLEACAVPIVADVDTGFGGTMNVAHMVREYEREGISAVCMEDKIFPKLNSFAAGAHELLPTMEFCRKLEVATELRQSDQFHIIARTEALIAGHGVDEALERCEQYVCAGADSVLVHSKSTTPEPIMRFLAHWGGRAPVIVVPTTYPSWNAEEAHAAGVSMIIYANQSLRATVSSMRSVLETILKEGTSVPVEEQIAPVSEIFRLQQLDQWLEVE
ncbi:isocitrate lyase/phosphoenolpyruvate mutase family protein [Nonomuraea sp. NPDC049714]|uniref:isocitrate lyase/phosphoenolpyruvate mutase family protein n=1 Tax=Nonomuraea sp. NPDC049714 TaxID=3364357 RepID=UPI0037899412